MIAEDLEDQLVVKKLLLCVIHCDRLGTTQVLFFDTSAIRLRDMFFKQCIVQKYGKSFYRGTLQIIGHQRNKRTGFISQFISMRTRLPQTIIVKVKTQQAEW